MMVQWPWMTLPEISGKAVLGVRHIESEFCWCDPIIEIDEGGEEIVVHREVTWN